jgi:valyl-tRNA synthetase
VDEEAEKEIDLLQELIVAARTARAENNVDPRKRVPLLLRTAKAHELISAQQHHLENLIRAETVEFVEEFPADSIQIQGVARCSEFSLILDDVIDVEAERKRLEKERERARSELKSLEQKLQNQAFLSKAPEAVVEKARSRQAEVLERLRKIDSTLVAF